MNKIKFSYLILQLFCLFLFFSCTNLFHDLLPSDKKEIVDFQIQYENGSCSEKYIPNEDNIIEIVVSNDTDITNLIPLVSISDGAEIVPLTIPYISKLFPEKDTLSLAIDMYLARENGTFSSWFINLVLDNGGIEIPPLDMPIDFSTSVFFVVISGSGKYEFYTVMVKKETPPPEEDDNNNNTPENPEIKEETDNFILSFNVPNQIGESKIYNSIDEVSDEDLNDDINSIGDKVPYSGLVSFEVGADFNLKEVVPTIMVSEGAKILPLTQEYILSLGISFADMINFYSGYSTTTNVEKYISSFLKKQNNIVYPEINIPINFDNTNVSFAVVSESGNVKIYNVKCKSIELKPILTKINFSKLNNEFLCKDSIGTITDNTIKATCMYPMEIEFDYGLIPEFVYEGGRVTYTMQGGIETELISGVTKIPFTETNRICIISVYIGSGETENKIEYELYCPIEYDPDSIRSIIDFRFYKSKNTQIKNTVLASIHNEGDTGFITATVMYEGEVAPYELVADFVSPGTVTKNGSKIITGVTSENFEYSTQYLCTSKNGLYCRLYDISIKFMQIVTIEPVINSFEFPSYLNKDLSKDCVAKIDDATKIIRCEVLYHSPNPPYNLIPAFTSSGTVTCDDITQTSGFSEQNFRYTNYYTVTTGDIELSTARYRIEVVFEKDDSSSCDILDFGFKIENNASLSSDVQATVTERTQKIFAFMPYGAGSQSGTLLTPTFTSNGTVSVNGQSQTSGISSQDFSSPITYTVTSLNGLYTKEYVVSLQESGSIIYVDKNAVGRNNGTSWDDAFINLDLALEQAALIPAGSAAEIWVTAPEDKTYVSTEETGFKLHKEGSITILGGFDGTEKNSSERQFDSNGNLLKRTKIQNYNNGTNGIFECNYLIKDYVYIEGFANTENNCEQFFYCIPTTGIYPTEPSFKDSNITINDCEFYVEEISYAKKNSYELTISNSKTHRISDWKTSAVCNYNIENCTFLETKIAYVHVYSRGGIKFNNNTMYGSTDINLTDVADAIIEFENNELLKSDKIEIKQLDYFTGNEIVIEEPVWYLRIIGNCNLFFSNMTFKHLYLRGVVAEVNNCDFICASVNNSSSGGYFSCETESEVIVNNSRFNNAVISRYDNNLILNNCEVSYKMDRTVIQSSGNGTLTINNGVYNLFNTFDNNFSMAIELDGGNTVINNAEMNIQSNVNNQGINFGRGDITINDGVYNFNFTQGYCMKVGRYSNVFPRVNINGGIFNFETSGSAYSFYANCDVSISNAKFNFTGDEYNSSYCVYFTNGTNGSTIKNCEFIIDKCTRGGFYANQAGLKIENSKFDINVYPQNSGDTCYGFYGYKDFSIDGGTYDLGNLYKSSSANMSIKNATVTANCPTALRLTENSVIDNSTVNLNCTATTYYTVNNYSDYITNTKFNFSGLASNSWCNYSSKLTNCYFNFSDVVFHNYYSSGVWLETSCTIIGCIFEGFTNPSNTTSDRGAAVRIFNQSEDCNFIFENCIFKNNKVIGEYNQGGAALTGHPGNGFSTRILLKNCSFINNQNLSLHYTNEAAHIVIFSNDEGEMFLTLEGTNIMTGPSCPDILNGCTFLKNEAVYIRTTSPITGTIN